MKKKILCFALTLVMLLGIFPIATFAVEGEKPITELALGGTPEEGVVYTISTPAELNYFVEYNSQGTINDAPKWLEVKLTADIDYTEEGAPAPRMTCQGQRFTGIFDGNGKTIKGYAGPIIARLDGTNDANAPAVVKNVTIANNVASDEEGKNNTFEGIVNSGNKFNGWGPHFSFLVQDVLNGGYVSIENCHIVDSSVTHTISAKNTAFNLGSILAYVHGNAGGTNIKISNCSTSNCSISYTQAQYQAGTNGCAGGLVGQVSNQSGATVVTIENCSADTDVTLKNAAGDIVSGILGNYKQEQNAISGDTLTIKNCINLGALRTFAVSGGILARGIAVNGTTVIENCLSIGAILDAKYGGGLMLQTGKGNTTIKNSYHVNRGGENYGFLNGNFSGGTLTVVYNGETTNVTAADKTAAFANTKLNSEDSLKGLAGVKFLMDAGYDFDNAWNVTAGLPTPVQANLAKRVINEDADIVYKGYQKKLVEGEADALSIRLVAGLDSTNYKNTGYKLSSLDGGELYELEAQVTTTVYTMLNAYVAGENGTVNDPITAEGLECSYLSAITISDLPTDRSLLLEVKPYVTNSDGSESYGSTIILIIEDGEVVAQRS